MWLWLVINLNWKSRYALKNPNNKSNIYKISIKIYILYTLDFVLEQKHLTIDK